ncbi:MAG: chorismate mutase, partial [Armatimonadota bacterium]
MDIQDLRKEIDAIDREVLGLLNKRAGVAKQIGAQKAGSKSIFIPERESQVFTKLEEANGGPLPDASVKAIYREVISACRAIEKPMQIAYWGPPATNTHMASISKFGSSCEFVPTGTIPDVFSTVERGSADYGVVPIENSTEGVINHTLDTFLTSKLRICSEIYLPITHYLLSKANDLSEIEQVYSIPTAAAQCRDWLRDHLPGIEIVDVSTTARGAQLCANEPASAAIGTSLAAEVYDLNLIAEHIEDNP